MLHSLQSHALCMHARTPTCFLLQHTCNSVRHISSLYACNGRRSRISGPSALSSQHPPLPRIDPSTFGRDSQLCCKAPHGPCWSKRPSGSCSHVGWVLRAGHAKFWNCLLCPSAWVVQKPGVIHASAARRAAGTDSPKYTTSGLSFTDPHTRQPTIVNSSTQCWSRETSPSGFTASGSIDTRSR